MLNYLNNSDNYNSHVILEDLLFRKEKGLQKLENCPSRLVWHMKVAEKHDCLLGIILETY